MRVDNMKNKVVSLFLKIYKKFFGKSIRSQKTPSEKVNLQYKKELQNQKKEKKSQEETIFSEAVRNEVNVLEEKITLQDVGKNVDNISTENYEQVSGNKDNEMGQEPILKILESVETGTEHQVESFQYSENLEESTSENQKNTKGNTQKEDEQNLEQYQEVSGKEEEKFDKAVEVQNKEKENLDHIYTREELEKLYEDHEELIIQPARESCLALLKPIEGHSKFITLRNRIYQEFPEVTLLCNIEINDEEYDLLCDYFRKKYLELRRNDGKCAEDVLFCVALVQMGIRTYDGKFWEHISELLWHQNGKIIPVNQHEWIGGLFTKTMLSFGKPIYRKTEYVNNILMHCFITDSFADKFLDFLYSFYNIDLERDISTDFDEISNYICDSIKNPFGKRKQLLSKYISLSVRADKRYCKEAIKTILNLIDQAFWNEFYGDFQRTRLIEKFFTWCNGEKFIKEIQKRKWSDHRKRKQFRTPYLKSFLDTNGFQLVLPSQLISSYIENAKLCWKIEGNKLLNFDCEIEEGYTGKRTKEIPINLSPMEIFDKYTIYFCVNEKVVRKYYFSETEAVFFSEDGSNVKGTNLGKGLYYAYVTPSSFIKTEGILNVRERAGLDFYELNLDNGNVISIDDRVRYYIGQVPREGLTEDYLLHSMYIKNEDQDLKVYYKLPAIILEIEPHQLNGTAMVINDYVAKFADKEVYEIKSEGNCEKRLFYLDLKRVPEIHVGINKILIDFPGTTRQLKFEFAYLPEFSYSFEDAPYFYVNRGTLAVNRVIHKHTIIFNKQIEAQQYDFQFNTIVNGKLNMKMEINFQQYEVSFDIPVLQYSWDNVQWETKRPYDIWYSELQDTLYIKYPAEKIALTVKTTDVECPSFTFFKNASEIFQCDLVRIRSYLNENKFVNNIILISEGRERKLLSVIMKSFLRGVTFEIDNEKECVYSNFDIIGKGNYFVDVYCNNEEILEKQAVNAGMNILNLRMNSSKYLVKVYENEGDLFSFDDDYKFVGEKEVSLVNPLHLTEACFGIDLIVDYEHTQQLDLACKYFLFFLQKIGKREYAAVLAEVFHNTQIHTASKVIVTIPNLNNVSEVYIEFIDAIYGERNAFLYDNYKQCIVEEESSRYSKSKAYRRYEHVLYPKDYIWIIHNVPSDKVILEAAEKWLKDSHKRKHKSNSIWKEDN